MIRVNIIADSITKQGQRITTLQLVYPRYIHSELMTHRLFSRNASSSRAIPVAKMADIAITEMVEPIRWGKNQAGMQATSENLEGEELLEAQKIWREMAETCAAGVKRLGELGLHKQWANRPLEWFSNIRVLLTSTEWDNWDELRFHKDAQPEIYELARKIKEAREQSYPVLLTAGEWHLPYIGDDERGLDLATLQKISASRCCRVSYLKHGLEPSIEEDLKLFERLASSRPRHLSPLEHQATPIDDYWFDLSITAKDNPATHVDKNENLWSGNLKGWQQFRHLYIDSQE